MKGIFMLGNAMGRENTLIHKEIDTKAILFKVTMKVGELNILRVAINMKGRS